MDEPKVVAEENRRDWLVAPRKGLLTSEFAEAIDVTPSAVRAAIRRRRLAGVRLRTRGKIYAYAATVDDVAAYYELGPEAVDHLKRQTQSDATGRHKWVGLEFHDQSRQTTLQTEFETGEEFDKANDA